MKHTILTILFSLTIVFAFSQDKKILKITDAYNSGDYDKCIKKADKYIKKNTKNPTPYYYIGLSNFQKSKQETGAVSDKYLQKATTNIFRATQKDKGKTEFNNIKTELTEVHDSMLMAGRRYNFGKDVGKAEYYFKYLVEIYNDTTPEYIDAFIPKPPCNEQILAFATYAEAKNKTDMKGMKQGLWVKYYESGCVEYEINFKDGKPVGIYRKYYENGELKAKLFFDDKSERASAILYNEDAQRVAMGYYFNKQKDSLWQYYKADSIMLKEEYYIKGVLNGRSTTYSLINYPDILDEKYYKDGKQDSIWIRNYFNDRGTPQFICYMKNGKREGSYLHFFPDKRLKMKGQFKNGLETGIWTYYYPDREGSYEIKYINGVPENSEELDEEQTKMLNKIKEERGKFNEPTGIDFMD